MYIHLREGGRRGGREGGRGGGREGGREGRRGEEGEKGEREGYQVKETSPANLRASSPVKRFNCDSNKPCTGMQAFVVHEM